MSELSEPRSIASLTFAELREVARERVPRGHGKSREIYSQVVNEGRFAPEELGLSDEAVKAWRSAFQLSLPEVARVESEETDSGTTAKAALRLHDGTEVEIVWIPMGRGRHTLCVSSQVGCKMGCRFCETARIGLVRNLSTEEIVSQILVARHTLGWDVRNVVFMGMGEALDNSEALFPALRVLNDPNGLALAQERLTVCTVGHLEGIRKLSELGMKRLNLSISLNSGDDTTRASLMPVHRRSSLKELQDTLVAYRPRRNFTLGVNFCLMPDINDSREDAARVAKFCAPISRVLVNVIGYNPGRDPLTRAPSDEEVDRFIGWLREEGLPVRKRITKGRSVMAACGQLGNPELRNAPRGGKARLPIASSKSSLRD